MFGMIRMVWVPKKMHPKYFSKAMSMITSEIKIFQRNTNMFCQWHQILNILRPSAFTTGYKNIYMFSKHPHTNFKKGQG